MEPTTIGGDRIVTALEAAEQLGVTPIRVRQLCQEHGFASARRVRLNERWVLLESDVRAYVKRPPGRPNSQRTR